MRHPFSEAFLCPDLFGGADPTRAGAVMHPSAIFFVRECTPLDCAMYPERADPFFALPTVTFSLR